MIIEVKDNGTAAISNTLNDGTISRKVVNLTDLCKALSSDTIDINMRVPANCRGVIDKGHHRGYLFIYDKMRINTPLMWTARDIDKYGKLEEYMPDKDDKRFSGLNIENIRVFNIPFPPMAIITLGYISENSQGEKTFQFSVQYAYALSNINIPLDMATYYRYPFTNVFLGANNCCMGHGILNSVPEGSVEYYPKMLYTSIGNHDLDVTDGSCWNNPEGDNSVLGKIKTQYQIISKLGLNPDIKDFPCAYLRPLGKDVYNLFDNMVDKGR